MISLFYGLNQQLRNHSPDWVQIPSTVHCAGTPEFPNPTPFLCTTYMTLHCTLHCMTFHSLPLDCIALHCIYCSAQNLYWFFSSLSLLKCNILGPIPHFQTHCCFHFGMNSSTIWPPVIVQSLLAPELTPGTWSNMVNLHTLAPSPSQCLKQPALSYTSYTFPVKIPSQSEHQRICTTQCCWRWIQMCSMCSICSMSSSLMIEKAPIHGTGGKRCPWSVAKQYFSEFSTISNNTRTNKHTEAYWTYFNSQIWMILFMVTVSCWTSLDQRKTGRDSSGTLPLTELFGSGRRVAPVVSICKIERYSPWGIPAIKHEDTWSLNSRKSPAITLNMASDASI